jgi:hypothetical protein
VLSCRYERPSRGGDSDNEIYSQGEVIPADKVIASAGFKVSRLFRVGFSGKRTDESFMWLLGWLVEGERC